jgi:SAM-dependent methyltransferase
VGLAEAVAPGEVIGIDLQPAQVERGRALAAERGVGNVRFEVGSVDELPFPDASFDAAFAHTLLMHVRDPRTTLREMRRVLKPGGVVGIADDDHGTFLADPPAPFLTEIQPPFMKVFEHFGAHPYAARHHRRALLDAGFARAIAAPTFWTGGSYGATAETQGIAAWFVDWMRQRTFLDAATGRGWADEARLEALASEALAWGERADAYMAVMGVAAVGWVER